jgi:hypothetical protein
VGFEAVLVAVLLAHETRMGEMLRRHEELKASPTS